MADRPGSFLLRTLTGDQDRFFVASKLLALKIKEKIECNKAKNAQRKPWEMPIHEKPSLVHLNTHVNYVKRWFRPFVATAHEYIKVQPTGSSNPSFGSPSVAFNITENSGTFLGDMVLHVQFNAVGVPAETDTTPADPLAPKYRYCDFPGARLLKEVRFNIDGNTICSYNRDNYIRKLPFFTSPSKQTGVFRGLGQELPETGEYYHSDFDKVQQFSVLEGPQTWKRFQDTLDLWIPLDFWFCWDPLDSFMNISANTLQKEVSVDLANLSEIFQVGDVNGTVSADQSGANQLRITKMELYTKNVFLNKEVEDLYINRHEFTTIRTYREQKVNLIVPEDDIKLNQLKYPVEHIRFSAVPLANNGFTNWYKSHVEELGEIPIPALIFNGALPPPSLQLVSRTGMFLRCIKIFERIGFKSSTSNIYNDIDDEFYNIHIPLVAGSKITTPRDCGLYMVNFAQKLDQGNPSGYINLSVDRDFCINYSAPTISQTNQMELIVTAECLQILAFTREGRAIIAYTT